MNKLALVTGGTRGIGQAISSALQNEGYTVYANYANNEEQAKHFYKATGIKVKKWDVSNYDDCIKNVAQIEHEAGLKVSVLVNNAGITRDAMLHKMTAFQWQEVIQTNLSSCFNMCHAVINEMRTVSYGRIINISSINALTGQLGQANYSAAKAGIIGMTKSLARESAAKNITVNAIAPGYIRTEMVSAIDPAILEKIIAQIPVKKIGEPKDIARAVLFLASEQADFITGEVLSINGGHHM